jgi:hypothetical protein
MNSTPTRVRFVLVGFDAEEFGNPRFWSLER